MIDALRAQLDQIPEDLRRIDQLVRAAALVVRAMEERGLFPVVVGGSAVAIYTEGSEATEDIDLVVEGRHLALDVLAAPGFRRGASAGVWWYPRLHIPIEIPDTVLAGDPHRVLDVALESGLRVHVIGLDDLILDRMDQAAAQRSPTGDARRQALLLMATYWEDLDQHYIREQARRRSTGDDCERFLAEAARLRAEIAKEHPPD